MKKPVGRNVINIRGHTDINYINPMEAGNCYDNTHLVKWSLTSNHYKYIEEDFIAILRVTKTSQRNF